MTIEEITSEANSFVYSDNVPFKHWLRAADSLYRQVSPSCAAFLPSSHADELWQGNAYVRDGNLAQAYLLLFRFSTLVIQHMPTHPEVKGPDGKKALKALRTRTGPVIETLEEISPHLKAAHEEWVTIHAAQRDASIQLEGEKSPYEKRASRDPALSWNPKVRAKLLDADDNQELAVNLANQETRRRDAARKATRRAGISEEEEQVRRSAGLWDDWDAPEPTNQRDDNDDIRRNMDAVRRRLDQTEVAGRPPSSDGPSGRHNNESVYDHNPPSYHYPSIRPSSRQYENDFSGDAYDRRSAHPPTRPPKPQGLASPTDHRAGSAPPRPSKEPVYSPYETPPRKDPPAAPERPPKMDVQRATEDKERYTFRPAAYLEDGTPIRPVFLPAGLRDEFLRIASPNTRKGLEMCGILCGTAVNNALFINSLIIPQQTCTSDTCETDNEEEVIDYCMREDLMVFGWIHTHPTQTCFMSSRDLHTQSGYQVMMPESIAIVCAPRSEPS